MSYSTKEQEYIDAINKYEVLPNGDVIGSQGKVKQSLNHNGYARVRLYVNGKGQFFRVHRLVALKYIGRSNNLAVNHIDGDKSNNHCDNLEYCTLQDNLKKYWDSGKYHDRIKLNEDKVKEIRLEYSSGQKTAKKISNELGLSYHYTCQVLRGEYW